jgi:hypothetical protein
MLPISDRQVPNQLHGNKIIKKVQRKRIEYVIEYCTTAKNYEFNALLNLQCVLAVYNYVCSGAILQLNVQADIHNQQNELRIWV